MTFCPNYFKDRGLWTRHNFGQGRTHDNHRMSRQATKRKPEGKASQPTKLVRRSQKALNYGRREKNGESWYANKSATMISFFVKTHEIVMRPLNSSQVTDSSRRGSASDLPDIGVAFSTLSFLPMAKSTSMEACK